MDMSTFFSLSYNMHLLGHGSTDTVKRDLLYLLPPRQYLTAYIDHTIIQSLLFFKFPTSYTHQDAVLRLTSKKVNPYNRSITSWHEGTPSMSTLKSILASLSSVGGTISAGLLALRTEGAMTPGIRRFCCAPMVVKKYKKSRVKRGWRRKREMLKVNQAVF